MYTHIDGGHAHVPMGKFKIGRIAESGEPHLTNRVQEDSWVSDPEWAHREGMVAFAGYPLKVESRVVGVVAAFARKPLTEPMRQAFACVADAVAQFIKRKQAEGALRLTQFCIEHATDAICWTDAEGRIVYVNEAACNSRGRPREELLTLSIPDVDPACSSEAWQSSWVKLKALGSMTSETCKRDKQGHVFPLEVTANYLEFDGKEYSCTFARDIRERKEAEKSQAFLASLVESTEDAIYGTTLEGAILSWNHGAKELYGYLSGEMIGRSTAILIPHDRSGELEPLRKKGRRGEQVSEYETRHVCKDGHLVDVFLTISPVRDTTGRIIGVATIARNISDRKRAEQQTRLQTAALESAAYGIAITDLEGGICWVNPAFTYLTGYSAEEILGETLRILKSGEQDVEFYEGLWRTILAGKVWQGELVNRRKDGTLYFDDTTITPVRDASGSLTHFVAIKQDVTGRRRSEQALQERTVYLNTLFQISPLGIIVLDTAGCVQMSNSAF